MCGSTQILLFVNGEGRKKKNEWLSCSQASPVRLLHKLYFILLLINYLIATSRANSLASICFSSLRILTLRHPVNINFLIILGNSKALAIPTTKSIAIHFAAKVVVSAACYSTRKDGFRTELADILSRPKKVKWKSRLQCFITNSNCMT